MFASCTALQKTTLQLPQKSIETYLLTQDMEFSIQVAASIEAVAAEWDAAAPAHNIFLQRSYLCALEQFPPEKMSFRYAVVYRHLQPIGVVYVQRFQLNLDESNQQKDEEEKTGACILKIVGKALKKWVMRRADYTVLIAGNLLLTGEHGFYFHPDLHADRALQLAHKSVDLIQKLWEREAGKIHLQLFKDFPVAPDQPQFPVRQQLPHWGFHQFQMQPSMQLRIQWKSFDDYLNAMTSKYRVRARRAFKKGTELQKRELSLEEIRQHQPRIHELYQIVANNAGFNAFWLHPHYFTALQEQLGERFRLVGYFHQDQLVAFRTTILNGKELEAHFLGVDDHYNREYQVYLNILYDLIGAAIYHQVEYLDFARTALEIKSSVGAVAHDMECFIRHRNRISNALLHLLIRYLSPKEEWQPRHPFGGHEEAEHA